MKRYEGLFILNTAGKEENVKEMIDRLSDDLTAGGAKVETVQKMDKRQFSRVTDKRVSSGFYVNIIFEADAPKLAALRTKFALNPDIFRVSFTVAPAPKPEAAPVAV